AYWRLSCSTHTLTVEDCRSPTERRHLWCSDSACGNMLAGPETSSETPGRNRKSKACERNIMRAMATSGDGAVRRDQASDLQLLIDSASSLIHTGSPDGYLDFFNQTWLTYVGQSLEDLQGWKWTAFIHPEDV